MSLFCLREKTRCNTYKLCKHNHKAEMSIVIKFNFVVFDAVTVA